MKKAIEIVTYCRRPLIASLFYLYNNFITHIPIYTIRHFYLRKVLKIKIGKNTSIHMGCFFTGNKIIIGNNCVINRRNYFDGRYGIYIGNNVSLSPECYLISLTHDAYDSKFSTIGKQVIIEGHSWIGARVIIMPGVYLANGTVVAAGSVVTKSFETKNCIIGGVPSKFITERKITEYNFTLSYFPFFDTDIT